MKRLMFLALPLLLAGSATALQAKAKPADLKWMDGPPGLPSGAQFAVVSGDPGKKGDFTVQIKMPADYAVPAHWHPSDEHLTILSGKLNYGMSDKLDKAKAKPLPKGGKVTMKAKHNHWVFTNGGATIQLTAMGPFAITYVDPKDDPRKQ
jgi:quercetin dioxygenase-like cupin family protein